MKKIKWTKSEIRMLLFSSGISLLFVGLNALYQWNNRVPELVIPQAAPPSPNAFDFFQDAAAAYVPPPRNGAGLDSHFDTTLNRPIALFSAEYSRLYPVANKLAFLKTNAKALRLLRQGLKCEYLQPPERDGAEKLKYMTCRYLAGLLLVESHARAQVGDWNGATDRLLDVLHFGFDLPHGGPLSAQSNGAMVRSLSFADFKVVMPHLSAAKAHFAARQIERWQNSQASTAQVLEEEKRALQAILLQLTRAGDFRPVYVDLSCIPPSCSNPQRAKQMNELEPLLRLRLAWMDKASLLFECTRCMNWQIAQVKKPYPLREHNWPFPESSDFLNNLIYPRFPRAMQFWSLRDAKTSLILTMLALRAFHLENHHYPKQLSELVPKYLARVPLDPFSNNKPLRYRFAPVRYVTRSWNPTTAPAPPGVPQQDLPLHHYEQMPFTLYSIGPNARDDGGTPYLFHRDEDEKRYVVDFHLPDTAKADIVAGIN